MLWEFVGRIAAKFVAGDQLITTMPSSRILLSHPEMFRWLNPIGRPQVEHEQLYPGRQIYARYLHVAEAAAEDEAQAAWDGLGGRLKALRREVVDVKAGQSKAEAGQAKAKADMAEVKADVSEVKADVAEVKAGQAEMKADVSEVKADISDMKALLEKLVAQSLQNAA
jgi:hypothetical protein